MKKFIAFALSIFSVLAFAQTSPGLVYGQVPTAGQWNSYFAGKIDYQPTGSYSWLNTIFASPPIIGATTPNTIYSTQVLFKGSISGTATLKAQAAAGTPTVQLPNTSGVLALVGANSLHSQVTTATGAFTFVAPASTISTTVFKFTLTGAGGGGCNPSGGGLNPTNGAAGGTVIWYVSGLTASATYNGSIGTGGTGGTGAGSPTSGTNGGNSTFVVGGTTITAGGGTGGTYGSFPIPVAGGTATNGTINLPGGAGMVVTTTAPGLSGASFWGPGVPSSALISGGTAAGANGNVPGVGGASTFNDGATLHNAGNGANGMFVAEWSL